MGFMSALVRVELSLNQQPVPGVAWRAGESGAARARYAAANWCAIGQSCCSDALASIATYSGPYASRN